MTANELLAHLHRLNAAISSLRVEADQLHQEILALRVLLEDERKMRREGLDVIWHEFHRVTP